MLTYKALHSSAIEIAWFLIPPKQILTKLLVYLRLILECVFTQSAYAIGPVGVVLTFSLSLHEAVGDYIHDLGVGAS